MGSWDNLAASLVKFHFHEPFPVAIMNALARERGDGENRKSDFMPLPS